jgi:hypothetical protein
MILPGLSNAGTEDAQKGGAGNTGSWDCGVDLGGCGEWLSGWDWGGAAACCLCRVSVNHINCSQRCEHIMGENLPLVPSGLAARLPGKWVPATGLAARDPWGVPLREVADGGFSLSFLVLPLSLSSPPDPAPISTSLPDPEPPSGRFRMRFLPA